MATGLKHDKIKFHEFLCVCNFFLSPPLSLFLPPSLSLSPVSPSLSPLYPPPFLPCISLSLPPRLSTYLSLTLVSLSIFLSHPCLSRRVWRFLLPADHGIGGLICPCLVAWSPWFIFLLYTYDYLYFILFSFQISVVI